MTIESVTYISDLNATYPAGGDAKSEGDDHIRNIKSAVKATFPNVSGAVLPTHTELNYVDGVTSAIQTQLDAKAPSASPTFTGTVVLPSTTSVGNVSSTELGYLDGVTSAIQTQLDAKAPAASPTFTGTVVLPSTTSIGTVSATEIGYVDGVTSAIQTQIDAKGAITGQAWTGTHTFPTQTAGDNSTKVATTAYADAGVSLKYVSTQTASSSAAITFTGLASGYDYLIVMDGVYPATNAQNLNCRLQNSGSDDTGANYYWGGTATTLNSASSPAVYVVGGTGAYFSVANSMSTTAANSLSGTILIINPSRASAGRVAKVSQCYINSSSAVLAYDLLFRYNGSSAADGIKFYMSSGNISAGTFTLYKIARS